LGCSIVNQITSQTKNPKPNLCRQADSKTAENDSSQTYTDSLSAGEGTGEGLQKKINMFSWELFSLRLRYFA
jgi:hypothetical protein